MTASLRSRLLRRSIIAVTLCLLLSFPVDAGEPCLNLGMVCGTNTGSDPWYGFILIDEQGKYKGFSTQSKAYNIKHEEVIDGTISRANCFIHQVRVFNDGTYNCWDNAMRRWDTAACSSIIGGVRLVDQDIAFSGRYTLLGDPTRKFPERVDTGMSNSEINNAFDSLARFLAVDDDYTIIGIDEEEYFKEMWRQDQRRASRNLESTVMSTVFTITRRCDYIGVFNDTKNCKRKMIFDKDLRIFGSTVDNVYKENVEKQGFEPCLWFLFDYGKFYRYPGVMIVLLNRSKFGTHKGFIFHAIVGMESKIDDHVYAESVFEGSYPGEPFGAESCCKIQGVGGAFEYRCTSSDTCMSDGPCPWSGTEIGGCWKVANSFCFNDCQVATNHFIDQSVLTWNKEAANRLIGCDSCEPGDMTCSMGSSLAQARKSFSSVFTVDKKNWPDNFKESYETCGFFIPWDMEHWVTGGPMSDWCNCLTGWRGFMDPGVTVYGRWSCDKDKCDTCNQRGYGCQWETGKGPGIPNACHNCHDPTPNGKPDEKFLNETIPSIQSKINLVGANRSWPKAGLAPVCGHNEYNGYE